MATTAPGMRFLVLGPLEVFTHGEGLEIKSRRQRDLLAVLLAARNEVVSADRLADSLWGDSQPADPNAALQTQISRLRARLDTDTRLARVGGGYRLEVGEDELDAAEFERFTTESNDPADVGADRVETALALWRGPAYADIEVPAIRDEAMRLDDLRLSARESLAAARLDRGDHVEAVADLERLIAQAPLRERAIELLMRGLYAAGRHSDALNAFRAHAADLADSGLEPSPELRDLEGEILRHELPGALRPESSLGWELPVAVTSLVGRESETDAVVELLGRARLVTLIGPGGVGKTRLAIATGKAVTGSYPDGVVFCDLAAVEDPDAVGESVASTLRVQQRSSSSVQERIVEVLRSKRALLIIDNCEHVVDAAAVLVDALIHRSSGVDVLATSRERLGVDGEHLHIVPELGYGDGDGPAPALELFTERARAVQPRFRIVAENKETVRDLCRRLDGLPLAIELAAARLRTRTPAEIVAELDAESASSAVPARRTGAQRHRSLFGVVDWSFGLLTDAARVVFARLSIFSGSFTRTDAANVVTDAGIDVDEVEGHVCDLVERSLLVEYDDGPSSRFRMLETLRAFGHEQLRAAREVDLVHRRHAENFVEFVEAADRGLRGGDEAIWCRRVDAAIPNLRAAHRWMIEAGEVDLLLRMSAALYWYAWPRMRSEVESWAIEAVDAARGSEHHLLPTVVGSAAFGAWQLGDFERARELARVGLSAAQRNEPESAALAYETLGDVSSLLGDLDGAEESYRRSLALVERSGDVTQAVIERGNIALVLGYGGKPEAAAREADLALEVAATTANPTCLAWADYCAGEARMESDKERASELLESSLRICDEVALDFVKGAAGLSAATLAGRQGRPEVAVRAYPELIEHWRRAGVWTQQWTTLRTLVELLARLGRNEPAATLAGAIDASQTAAPAFGADAARMQDALAVLEARLGERYEAARATGAEMDSEAVLAYAHQALGELVKS